MTRPDTAARRAWILEHAQSITLTDAARHWRVDPSLIRADERALGLRLQRSHPERRPHNLRNGSSPPDPSP